MLGKAVHKKFQSKSSLPHHSVLMGKREGLCLFCWSFPTHVAALLSLQQVFLTEMNTYFFLREGASTSKVFHPSAAATRYMGSSSSLLLNYNTQHLKQTEQTKHLYPLLHKPSIWYHLHLLKKNPRKLKQQNQELS